jgi:hypothetical protein
MARRMRWLVLVMLAACADEPLPPDPPSPIVVASWDPVACTGRVAIELTGSAGSASGSAPCTHGELVLDVPDFGAYRANVDARELDVIVDQLVVELAVEP